MWQTENDLRYRIRDLDSRACENHAQLFDTITETDGSAESSRRLRNRLMSLVEHIIQKISRRSGVPISDPASVGPAK